MGFMQSFMNELQQQIMFSLPLGATIFFKSILPSQPQIPPKNIQHNNHNKNNIMLGFLFFNLNERGERSEEALSAAAVNIRFGLSCRT